MAYSELLHMHSAAAVVNCIFSQQLPLDIYYMKKNWRANVDVHSCTQTKACLLSPSWDEQIQPSAHWSNRAYAVERSVYTRCTIQCDPITPSPASVWTSVINERTMGRDATRLDKTNQSDVAGSCRICSRGIRRFARSAAPRIDPSSAASRGQLRNGEFGLRTPAPLAVSRPVS